MAIQKTEAVVLKTQAFRSSSLIVTFFSRSFGKLRGVVKGVRREGELRGALYELFTDLEIVFYEKSRSDLHLVSEAAIMESFEPLRSGLEPAAYASYFCELTDELCEVHDPHEKIFELLQFCFRYLTSLPGKRLARLFELKILHEIGWLPYLEACLDCGKASLEKGFFSARQGALLCPQCAPRYADARPLSADPLAAMRYYILHDLEESIRLPLSHKAEEELQSLLNRFLLDRLGKPLKARQFLEKIKPVLK